LRLIAGALVLLLLAGAGIWWHRSTTDTCVTAKDTVTHFQGEDGTRLEGVVAGGGPAGVVLAPQSWQGLCGWLPFARQLGGSGFQAMAVDLPLLPLQNAAWDHFLAAAATYLRGRGATSVVLLGASLGGAASMVASANIVPAVDGVVSFSGERRVAGLDADRAVTRSSVPLLIIASESDHYLNSHDARALYMESATADKELLILPGSNHGTAILDGPDGSRVRALVVGFLRSHSHLEADQAGPGQRSRGSKASRTALPNMLAASTVTKMVSPGKITSHPEWTK